jgi:hypothetical protein
VKRALLIVAAIAVPSLAAAPRADYDALQKWRFSAAPITLNNPVTISRDTATWTLKSGRVRLMEPLPDGRSTGFVFEGQGRFTMEVRDHAELAQLRRFAAKPDLQSLATDFNELVFRTSDDTVAAKFAAAEAGYTDNDLARGRLNHWLIDRRVDVDAAILAALANEGTVAIAAAMKTPDFGWLDYDFDSNRPEAVQLVRFFRDFPEVWISLASGEAARVARLDAIDVKADLTHYSLTPSAGETRQRKIKGHYEVMETLTVQRDGVSALRMQLHPIARDVKARDERGEPLTIIRDAIGERSANLENKFHDPVFTIFFPAPMSKGTQHRITFEYELETENYALGRSWYPSFAGFFDKHTATLDLLVNRRNVVRSMGTLRNEVETDRGKRSVWSIERPTIMVTFSTAERFEEATVEKPGVPPITSFGGVARLNPQTRVRKAGEDVANAIDFFQTLLDDKLDTPRLFVTSITGEHGQAFDGFLHLSERSYSNEPGEEELFRAHETAHSWFGHKVRWKSYRDQWLTESISEYLGMMFVEARVKNGPRLFNEILDSYEGIVRGNWSGGFSKFSRPGLMTAMRNASFRSRIGPIGHGFRAGTGEMPFGYMVQVYYKGPLVMHMLRMLLRYETGSDDAFVRVLRDFVHTHSGGEASSADLQRSVESVAGGDWTWFFEQWIYGAELPSLRARSTIERVSEGWRVTVKTEANEEDFAPVVMPVRVELADGSTSMMLVKITKPEQSESRVLSAEPRRVLFSPEHSLLANVSR